MSEQAAIPTSTPAPTAIVAPSPTAIATTAASATATPPPRRRWTMWILPTSIVALAGATALVWAGQLTRKPGERTVSQPRLVRVAVAKAGDAIQTITLSATARPAEVASVVARSSGYIADIAVDLGDHVKRGQLLAVISATEGVNDLQAARSLATAADETARLAAISRDRSRQLSAQDVASREELDRSESEYKRSQAAAAAARATVERYATLTGYQRVIAPTDGVITRRFVDPGAMAQAGQTSLFQLARTSELDLEFDVPQAWAALVAPGLSVEVVSRDIPGKPLAATITRTAAAIDPTTRTMRAEVRIAEAAGIIPGAQVDIRIKSARSVAPIIVPARALSARADGLAVALVQADHMIWTNVVVQRDLGKDVELVADGAVAVGARVILSPPVNLSDNDAIEIAQEPPSPPASGSGASSSGSAAPRTKP